MSKVIVNYDNNINEYIIINKEISNSKILADIIYADDMFLNVEMTKNEEIDYDNYNSECTDDKNIFRFIELLCQPDEDVKLFYIRYPKTFAIIVRHMIVNKDGSYKFSFRPLITFKKSGKIVYEQSISLGTVKHLALKNEIDLIQQFLKKSGYDIVFKNDDYYLNCQRITDADNGTIFNTDNHNDYLIKINDSLIKYNSYFQNFREIDYNSLVKPIKLCDYGNIFKIKSTNKIFTEDVKTQLIDYCEDE